MIPPELEATILRLVNAEKWRIGTVAAQLGIHRMTVQRVLAQAGMPKATVAGKSSIDRFVPLIEETLLKYPTLPATRLYEMCRARGHIGSPDHFRHFVALHRPRTPAEAFARLSTLPGEQGQVD
jgi:transposase